MSATALQKFERIYFKFFYLITRSTAPDILEEQPKFAKEWLDFKDNLLALICAFNRFLSGDEHPMYQEAKKYLHREITDPLVRDFRDFLLQGVQEIRHEIEKTSEQDSDFAERLDRVFHRLQQSEPNVTFPENVAETFWHIFFPEGVDILKNKAGAEATLRQRRKVTVRTTNPQPLTDLAAEILFTSNVLLTVPLPSQNINDLPVSAEIKTILKEFRNQPQTYWYDHPVPVGIAPENNEILYGLRALNEMMTFEKKRGVVKNNQKLTVVLSCSATHPFLHSIAKKYLHETIEKSGGFEHLNVFLITEQDAKEFVQRIMKPAWQLLNAENSDVAEFSVFGVDGEYGRHYSFLKAIAAFWQVLIDPKIRATFKIDLDQVFDEERLLSETGRSALEHFRTALWGANGLDSDENPIHLGMIAGALVNAADIKKSLFTPDVPYPDGPKNADEFVFFSQLPQAVSTVAEMMTRYNSAELDGEHRCLQRVHVTGGTNGILVDALRKFKPFTPSFIGRAEDQAYLLSTMAAGSEQLGYLHKDGLIMRHDKDLFAAEAIKASEIGKWIGDYERILYFSAYARVLSKDYRAIKRRVDPFTGCFISAIPKTVVYLRFVFKLFSLLQNDAIEAAKKFVTIGIPRLRKAMAFCEGENSPLKKQFTKERAEWDAFYRTLAALEERLEKGDKMALELQKKARELMEKVKVN